MDAVASGFCADVEDGVAGAGGVAEEDVFVAGDAESEHVDEGIAE